MNEYVGDLRLVTFIVTALLSLIGHTLTAIGLWLLYRNGSRIDHVTDVIPSKSHHIHVNGNRAVIVKGNVGQDIITGDHNTKQ